MTAGIALAKWQPVLRAWATTPEHQARLQRARKAIAAALACYRQPYVAYSGGKDSTVVLHLVLQQAPTTTVFHWDYGPQFIPRWLADEMVDNARRLGATRLLVRGTRRVGKYYGLSEMFGCLAREIVETGHDAAFVGLRAEESRKRQRRIARGEAIGRVPECWPIWDWSWRDVWAYIFARDLPYLSVYARYVPVVGIERARLCTFFDPEFAHLGAPALDGLLMWRDRHVYADLLGGRIE